MAIETFFALTLPFLPAKKLAKTAKNLAIIEKIQSKLPINDSSPRMPLKTPSLLPRVLIVDDHPESVSLLLSHLKGQGLDVLVALDGMDAIRKARSGMPELILLDVVMPEMDGYEVCRKLKADPLTAGIPVIFLTAGTRTEDKLLGFSAGGADYITKPFVAEEVIARIHVHLHAKRTIDRLASVARSRLAEEIAQNRSVDEKLFTKALSLLEKDFQNPPQAESLASALGCNMRKLTGLFRKHTGMSVADYCFELRMESAKRLLRDTDTQIQLIADHAGYKNPGDFTRAFQRRYGVGPREYRQIKPTI